MELMDFKLVLGIIAAVVSFLTYLQYFIELVRGTAKPHVFSWATWGLLTGLGFILSSGSGGASGAWIFGVEAIFSLGIAVYAIFRGEQSKDRWDWLMFIAALVIMAFYVLTQDAVASAVLAALIDSLGFVPTFRKSHLKPWDEPIWTYALSSLGYLLSLLALAHYGFVTVFYPLVLVVTNGVFVFFLITRRHAISKAQ
jgi:hypothetical protein